MGGDRCLDYSCWSQMPEVRSFFPLLCDGHYRYLESSGCWSWCSVPSATCSCLLQSSVNVANILQICLPVRLAMTSGVAALNYSLLILRRVLEECFWHDTWAESRFVGLQGGACGITIKALFFERMKSFTEMIGSTNQRCVKCSGSLGLERNFFSSLSLA